MKTLRFVTIMLTALSMGAAFAHLLEMPAKRNYDGRLWLRVQQTLYPGFGAVAGPCEVAAVPAGAALIVASRKRPRAFPWTVLGASCAVATQAIFWIFVAPVNAAMVPLTPDTLPADWTHLRDQWEYSHGTRAILQIIGLGAFVLSILAETPQCENLKPHA